MDPRLSGRRLLLPFLFRKKRVPLSLFPSRLRGGPSGSPSNSGEGLLNPGRVGGVGVFFVPVLLGSPERMVLFEVSSYSFLRKQFTFICDGQAQN